MHLQLLYTCLTSGTSAGFTYRLDMLKPMASKSRGPLVNMHNIFETVIGLFFTYYVTTHCNL